MRWILIATFPDESPVISPIDAASISSRYDTHLSIQA